MGLHLDTPNPVLLVRPAQYMMILVQSSNVNWQEHISPDKSESIVVQHLPLTGSVPSIHLTLIR